MQDLYIWAFIIIGLVLAPLTSILYFLLSWAKYRDAIPFTEEKKRRKTQFIIASIIAGIMVVFYVTVMTIYGVTVFFA